MLLLICQNESANSLIATGTNLKWYSSQFGGMGSSTAPTPSTLTAGNQSFWVSQSDANGNCESARVEIAVIVHPIPSPPIVNNPAPICQNQTVLPLNVVGTNLQWYSTAIGGLGSNTAPIISSANIGTQSFWVTQSNGFCESARSQIDVVINPNPISSLQDQTICDGQSIILDAGNGFTSYLWNTTPAQTSQTIPVTAVGTYSVTVSNSFGCTSTKTIEVSAGKKPTISNIISTENSIEIFAIGGEAPYLYSLDGIVWQSSNIFNDLSAGMYQVFVKSAEDGCETEGKTTVIKIINTFSPNDDGINDTFKITYIGPASSSIASLYIYDRYGKLIKSLEDSGSHIQLETETEITLEWDGKYQGRPIPSGTYWYRLELGNGYTKNGWIVVKNRDNSE